MTAPRRPQSTFAPERLLGHLVGGAFKLLRVVGTGGTATVYEAQELGTSRRCAVKVLHPNPQDQTAGARFVMEGEIAQRLMGPHAVEIIRAGQMEGGQPFLVMEFLEGEDLAARLEKRGRLPPGDVVGFVFACAQVLERAHAAGVIHRDLKPANVFYAKRPQGEEIKLLDFGAAKDNLRNDKLTAAGQVVGTPWYMSPEQARGQGLDARSDEFSLAIIAYQALSGRVPFDAPRPTDVLFKIVSEALPPLLELAPEVQAAVEPVLNRALAKKAAERFASIQAFADGLKGALAPWSAASKPSIAVDVGAGAAPKLETADDELAMVLQAHSLVTDAQLAQAQAMARKDGGDLSDALLRLGFVTEAKLLAVLPMPSHWRPVPSERIRLTLPPEPALAMVSVDLATRLRVLPFGWTPIKGEIRVFAAFPAVPNLEAELKRATKAQKVAVYVTSPGAVHAAIRRWYYGDPTAFTELLPSGAGPRSPVPPSQAAAPAARPAPASPAVSAPTTSTPILSGTLMPEEAAPPPAAVPKPTPSAPTGSSPPRIPRPASPAPTPAAAPAGPIGAPTTSSPAFVTAPSTPAAAAPFPSPPPPQPASAVAPPTFTGLPAAAPPSSVPGNPPRVASGESRSSEWRPPPAPPPRPAPAPTQLVARAPMTGEFDLLALDGEGPETQPAPVAPPTGTQPVVEPSPALFAATAAYPVINDMPVVPYHEDEPPRPPAAGLDAATSSYPVVTDVGDTPAESALSDVTPSGALPEAAPGAIGPELSSAEPAPALGAADQPEPVAAIAPVTGHGASLEGMTGSFSIVIEEPVVEESPPPAPVVTSPSLPAPSAPSAGSMDPAPQEDFAVDIGDEPAESLRQGAAEDDIAIDDEQGSAPPAEAMAEPPPPPDELAPPHVDPEPEAEEPVQVAIDLTRGPPPPPAPDTELPAVEAAPSVSPPAPASDEVPPTSQAEAVEVEAVGAEVSEADEAAQSDVEAEVHEVDALDVQEEAVSEPALAPAPPLVEAGNGVRLTSAAEPSPALAERAEREPEEDSDADLPVARRPTRTDVRPLSEAVEVRELGLGELSRIQTIPAPDAAPAPSVAAAADSRPVLAAPELVRQALGRVAEVARADRVALVVAGGETWADPSAAPPLFASEWIDRMAGGADPLTFLGPELHQPGGPAWLEGATTAVAVAVSLGDAGRGVLALSARTRDQAFGEGDRSLLGALARQLARVFSVAQAPARDRLDLEAWLAGERHLASLADRASLDDVQARSREAVVLCVDARPWLSAMSDLGPAPMLERMNELVEDVSRTVYAHGGLLERVQGDGLVAVWGALADGADDWATEALRVAEAVQSSQHARLGPSSETGLRVGLHAARVSVGPVGLRGRRSLCVVGAASAIGFRLGSLGDGFPVASEALLKRAGMMGPEGLDARVRRLDSADLGVEAYSVQPVVATS